jgi:hypothetical protein
VYNFRLNIWYTIGTFVGVQYFVNPCNRFLIAFSFFSRCVGISHTELNSWQAYEYERKTCPCERHDHMKTHEEVKACLHSFLILELHEDDRSASCTRRFGPRGNIPQFQQNGKLGGPQSRSGWFRVDINVSSMRKIWPQSLGLWTCILVNMPNTLAPLSAYFTENTALLHYIDQPMNVV